MEDLRQQAHSMMPEQHYSSSSKACCYPPSQDNQEWPHIVFKPTINCNPVINVSPGSGGDDNSSNGDCSAITNNQELVDALQKISEVVIRIDSDQESSEPGSPEGRGGLPEDAKTPEGEQGSPGSAKQGSPGKGVPNFRRQRFETLLSNKRSLQEQYLVTSSSNNWEQVQRTDLVDQTLAKYPCVYSYLSGLTADGRTFQVQVQGEKAQIRGSDIQDIGTVA